MAVRKTWESKYKTGDTAPDFKTILHDGSSLDSQSLRGTPVILFFYNTDGTETCTREACNIRDNYQQLLAAGYQVFGVSKDSERKHQNFRKKYNLPYPLISDKNNVLAKAFDIFGEKHFMGRISDAVHRTTFVIDKDWKFENVIHPVVSGAHADQILLY
ncbi:MAG: peroxiredoxin [Bacteroidetes bacterium]|nr:MAG: peroxiredoxin [Bacteroidota bacterium]